MLGWLKRITPPPGAPPIEAEPPNPGGGERLERLLVRLGTDLTTEVANSDIDGKAAAKPLSDPVATTAAAETVIDVPPMPEAVALDAPVAPMPIAAIPDAPASSAPKPAGPDTPAAIASPTVDPATADALDAETEVAAIPDSDVAAIVDAAVAAIAEAVMATQAPEAPTRPVAEHPHHSSQMRVIAVCSQKGGSGKTTIAAHLAVQAGLAGNGPAVLIDTDPQGSLAEWWRARSDDVPALATVKLEDLAANLQELQSYGTEIVVIDTPPALTASIEEVIAIADLVIIPARPSPHDLRAVGATVEMVRRAGKPFVFVLNGAAQRANITVQAVAALSEHGRVSPVILYQRTEYAASMIDGRTVVEAAPSGKSAQEIGALWKFVHAQVGVRQAAAA